MQRIIITFKRYFLDFYDEQDEEVQTKIEWTLTLISTITVVPVKYLKHIEGTKGLYEIRIEVNSNIYRIFCFFYEGNIIVLGNAFQKKTEKTPKSEITKALKIMEEYKNENDKK
ncbi:MAG: type II toxin-antitoxin system RelE/ParE family toxin [Sediminibacterium sp.]|jgi:phage-related protein|nr:MAG: type II toxin-antitoxin system RelE/ParE family toxin [Sediminibacterium sp.]